MPRRTCSGRPSRRLKRRTKPSAPAGAVSNAPYPHRDRLNKRRRTPRRTHGVGQAGTFAVAYTGQPRFWPNPGVSSGVSWFGMILRLRAVQCGPVASPGPINTALFATLRQRALCCGLVKMDSGSSESNLVEVRVLSWAPCLLASQSPTSAAPVISVVRNRATCARSCGWSDTGRRW